MAKKYKPIQITLSPEIVKLVHDAAEDGPPETQEEWNEMVAEILEEYFNF